MTELYSKEEIEENRGTRYLEYELDYVEHGEITLERVLKVVEQLKSNPKLTNTPSNDEIYVASDYDGDIYIHMNRPETDEEVIEKLKKRDEREEERKRKSEEDMSVAHAAAEQALKRLDTVAKSLVASGNIESAEAVQKMIDGVREGRLLFMLPNGYLWDELGLINRFKEEQNNEQN